MIWCTVVTSVACLIVINVLHACNRNTHKVQRSLSWLGMATYRQVPVGGVNHFQTTSLSPVCWSNRSNVEFQREKRKTQLWLGLKSKRSKKRWNISIHQPCMPVKKGSWDLETYSGLLSTEFRCCSHNPDYSRNCDCSWIHCPHWWHWHAVLDFANNLFYILLSSEGQDQFPFMC